MKVVKMMGVEMPLTKGLVKKIKSALAETQGKLDKELGYPEDLQHKEMVAFYHQHLTKLKSMLEV